MRRGLNEVGLRILQTPQIPDVAAGTVEALDRTGAVVIEEMDVTVMPPAFR